MLIEQEKTILNGYLASDYENRWLGFARFCSPYRTIIITELLGASDIILTQKIKAAAVEKITI